MQEPIQRALALLHAPYDRLAYDPSPEGVNCVGLVRAAYPLLPGLAAGIVHSGLAITPDHIRPGDLIVIRASEMWSLMGRPWHFGLVVDNQTMVHASSKRGVELKAIPWHKDLHFRRI